MPSSHHSSHQSSREHNKIKIWRKVFAFVTFVAIVLTSFSTMAKLVFVNEDQVATIFKSEEYVNGMYEDVCKYSSVLCTECGVSDSVFEDVITRKKIKTILTAYTFGTFGSKLAYSASSYMVSIDELEEELKENIISTVKESNITYDGKLSTGAEKLAGEICDYISTQVQFKYGDNLRSIVKTADTICNVVIIASLVMMILFMITTYSVGKSSFRILRDIAQAILAAGVFHFVVVGAVELVKATKDLVIYPSYLADSIMAFVNRCQIIVAVVGACLILLSLVLTAEVWSLKHNSR